MRKYPIVESGPYCCVAACLESVLRRHGITYITQYDIANDIGLVVFEEDKGKLPIELTNIRYTTNPCEVGMHLHNNTLNDFFKSKGLTFQESYINWREIGEINIDSIISSIDESYDAIFYFDFGFLYAEEHNRGIGHSGLLLSLDSYGMIDYINPGPRFIGEQNCSSEDLVQAIRVRKGGISVIREIHL